MSSNLVDREGRNHIEIHNNEQRSIKRYLGRGKGVYYGLESYCMTVLHHVKSSSSGADTEDRLEGYSNISFFFFFPGSN